MPLLYIGIPRAELTCPIPVREKIIADTVAAVVIICRELLVAVRASSEDPPTTRVIPTYGKVKPTIADAKRAVSDPIGLYLSPST